MARTGNKRLQFSVDFTANISKLTKQLDSELNSIKNVVGKNDIMAPWFEGVKSRSAELKTVIHDMTTSLTKPGLTRTQFLKGLNEAQEVIKNINASLARSYDYLNRSFNSKGNQDNLVELKALEKQYNKLQKAKASYEESNSELKDKRSKYKQSLGMTQGEISKNAKIASRIQKKNPKDYSKAELNFLEKYKDLIPEIIAANEDLVASQEKVDKVFKKLGFKDVENSGELNAKIVETRGALKSKSETTITPEQMEKVAKSLEPVERLTTKIREENKAMGPAAEKSSGQIVEAAAQEEQALNSVKSVLNEFGISLSAVGLVRGLKQVIKQSWEFYKSLDAALTEISIVSNYSRDQVQALTGDFISLSQKTGMAIDDIAQASVIFFQQGLDTEAVMTMTEVTAQFAKVAGEDVTTAADQLTAAVNGFQIGVEHAIDVADKLNAVAAKSAASIEEISTAMEKSAAQANQAGVSMDRYLAYIATMEEVTREAPENIGTSLKTIMARFQQVKMGGTSEDGETDVNAVETALKSVGIALRDSNNQLRDLDDVLSELGPKWNSLDRNTQAYLGTVIAGTRQQSRFIALMQNWDRALELTAVSEQSAGQQALMHAKAMDGLDASINTLTNSWQKFLTTLTNSDTFISILNLGSKILQNISKTGGTANVVLAALNTILAANSKRLIAFSRAITDNIKGLRKWWKEAKTSGGVIQKLGNNWKETGKRLEEAQKLVDATGKSLKESEKKIVAFGEVQELDRTIASLEASKQKYDENGLSVEELRKKKDDLITANGLENATVDSLTAEYNENNIAYQHAIQAQNEAFEAMNKTTSIVMFIISGIQTLTAALGIADKWWVQFSIAAIAAVTAIYMVMEATDKKLMASGNAIYMILKIGTLVLSAVVAVINGIKALMNDGSENLQELKDKQDEYTESIKATEAALKSMDSYIDTYDKLSGKILKTTEDQEQLNEAIKAMADYYDLDYIDNQDGTYGINMSQVRKKRNEEAKELEKTKKEARKNSIDLLDQATKTARKQKFSAGAEVGMKALSVLAAGMPGGQLLAAGLWAEADTKKMKAELEARKEIIGEYRDVYVSLLDDLTDMSTEFDALGNVVVSATDKTNTQNAIYDALYDQLAEKYKTDANYSAEDLEKELTNLQKRLATYFEENKGAYTEMVVKHGEFTERALTETYRDVSQSIDRYYENLKEEMLAGLDPNSSEYAAAYQQWQAMHEAAYTEVFGSLGTNLKEMIEKYTNESNAAMVKLLSGLSVSTASAFNDLGLFDSDPSGNTEKLLELLSPKIEDIQAAYSKSGEAGALALIKALQEILNDESVDDTIKYFAQRARDSLLSGLEVSSLKTWTQLADTIDEITSSLTTMNKLMKSFRENGGWTIDEFRELGGIMDEISASWSLLDDATRGDYLAALQNINLAYDEQNNLISADATATQMLQQIQETAAKAKIQQTINGLKAAQSELKVKLAAYDAEIAATESMIKSMQAKAETGVTASELETMATDAYAEHAVSADAALANVYESMGTNATNMAAASIEGLNAVGQALNAIATGDYESLDYITGDFRNKLATLRDNYIKRISSSAVAGDYINKSTGGIDKENMEAAIGKMNDYVEGLREARGALQEQYDTVTAQITWWEKLSKADLSGWGTEASKDAEKYVSKLKEMLELITHIQRETFKLAAYQKLYEEQTGKHNVKNLMTQIELVQHLTNDYKKAYEGQKQSLNQLAALIRSGYGDIISFEKDGSYSVNYDKYNLLSDKNKEELDELIEQYDTAIDQVDEYYENLLDKLVEEKELRQEVVNKYIEAEDELVEAIKQREEKILDNKLAAIDKEIEAIERASEARRKAREEEEDAKELSSMQVDLQRALMDSSGASATQILNIQKQIKDKQQEMADNSFDTMVEDMKTQLEEEKEMEQQLFDERLEEMDWYWDEVDRIMAEGTESVLDTMQLYLDEFNQASELQQVELLKGWEDTFGQAAAIGKEGASTMQKIVSEIQGVINTQDIEAYLQYLTDGTVNTQYSGRTTYRDENKGSGKNNGTTPSTTTKYTPKTLDTSDLTIGNNDKPEKKYEPPVPKYTSAFGMGDLVKGTEAQKGYKMSGKKDDNNTASFDGGSYIKGMYYGGQDFIVGDIAYDKNSGAFMYKATNSGATFENMWFKGKKLALKTSYGGAKVKVYKHGGMVYGTGPAWLDGTSSHPEAVLNAMQTKAFLSFTDDLAALRAEGGVSTNSSVVIDNISFNVESMSSVADGEKAFNTFVDKFKEIGAKQGISILGTANRN